jgi:hypothetical protein
VEYTASSTTIKEYERDRALQALQRAEGKNIQSLESLQRQQEMMSMSSLLLSFIIIFFYFLILKNFFLRLNL